MALNVFPLYMHFVYLLRGKWKVSQKLSSLIKGEFVYNCDCNFKSVGVLHNIANLCCFQKRKMPLYTQIFWVNYLIFARGKVVTVPQIPTNRVKQKTT